MTPTSTVTTKKKGLVGCYMMVLNAEKIIRRTLSPLAGYIDELAVLDTGSADGTVDAIEQISRDVLKVPLRLMLTGPALAPGLYFGDDASEFGGQIPGPFTGLPVIADWSNFFNWSLGLLSDNVKYALRMDSDDVIEGAHGLRQIADLLDNHAEINIVKTIYDVRHPDGSLKARSLLPRVIRKGAVSWKWCIHEQLEPRSAGDDIYVQDGMKVIDMNDSPGNIRIEHRNAKVLYRSYLQKVRKGEMLDPMFLMTVGHEMIAANPIEASAILGQARYVGLPDSESRAEVSLYLGQAAEALGHHTTAFEHYSSSWLESGNLNALLRRTVVCMATGRKQTAVSDLSTVERLAVQRNNLGINLAWLREAAITVRGQ